MEKETTYARLLREACEEMAKSDQEAKALKVARLMEAVSPKDR